MPWALKIRPPAVQCGDCGKPRRPGERHTCVIRLDRRARPGGTKVRAASAGLWSCPDCGKPGNPFTHRCVKRTDFARRKADAEKQRKAEERKRAAEARKKQRRKRDEHPAPDECLDEDCPRYGCAWFRRGYERGVADGSAAGYSAGHAAGYAEGEAAGQAAGHTAGYSEGYGAASDG
jgi:hypothetical protein